MVLKYLIHFQSLKKTNNMCQDNKNNNNSLFIIGLIFGALIASAILLTSTKDKAKIIDKIKNN